MSDPRIEAAARVLLTFETTTLSLDDVPGPTGRDMYRRATAAVAAIDKAGTIETFTALDSLPDGSVIIDKHGDVSQRRGDWWCSYQTADLPSRQVAKFLPAQLIHRGTK